MISCLAIVLLAGLGFSFVSYRELLVTPVLATVLFAACTYPLLFKLGEIEYIVCFALTLMGFVFSGYLSRLLVTDHLPIFYAVAGGIVTNAVAIRLVLWLRSEKRNGDKRIKN